MALDVLPTDHSVGLIPPDTINRVTDAINKIEEALGVNPFKGQLLYNVKQYGAIGDGIADDTVAIRLALAAAAVTGGTVLMPAGRYKISGTLTLASNVALVGAGIGVTVLAPAFGGSPPNRVIDNDWTNGNINVSLRDFTLDRSGANVQHGILLNGITNLLIDSIEVTGQDSTTSGAIAVSGIGPSVRLLSTNVRVVNCRFGLTDNFGVQVSYVLNCTIANNTFEDCYREVIGVEPETGCTAQNVSIVGNTITTGTIPAGGSATGVIVVTTSSGGTIDGVTVGGNTVRNTNIVNTNTNPGITVLGGTNVTVTGNLVNNVNGPGLNIGSASIATVGCTIVGNQVVSCGQGQGGTFLQSGISLRQAVQCLVVGNRVGGSRHTASVFESSSASRNLIAHNQFLDTTPVTLLAGSNSTVRLNGTNATGGGTRVVTAVNYTVTGNEETVAVTDTSVPRTVTLPAANAVSAGRAIRIKDESGGALTNNITVARAGTDTIEGAVSKVINTNFGSVTLYSNGTSQWFVV